MKRYLICIFLFVLVSLTIKAQVSVPREGFPYCEPFTGSSGSLRAETIIGGSASVGNGYLQLTANDTSQAGYVYIDIPFSSAYGIKASFEYVSFGGSNPGADGFSFFMFDGTLGPNAGPNQFKIGGFGGALGYAPLTWPAPLAKRTSGLKGGYIGIAFDEWGNFVREFEKDSLSHLNSPNTPSPYGLGNNPLTGNGTYPHTVSIRGPHNATGPDVPYGLIDYREVNSPSYTPFPFRIDVPSNVVPNLFNCGDQYYRKVFIELVPVGGFYQVSVKMRIGNQIVDVFNGPVNYDFSAPNSIKLGFAAATGWNTNYHLIRNLAVDVSTINEALRPEASDNEKRTCVDEAIEITIDDIDLKAGANAFIQCVQLYDPALLGTPNPPWSQTTANIDHLACGPADICKECSTANLEYSVPGLGTFVLEPLGDLEYDSNGNLIGSINDIKVTFTPLPGAVGTAEVLYTAQDNYGLISEPAVIRVIINPIPKILTEAVDYPTCDGQGDGEIRVRVGDLLDGATYRWLWNGSPITVEAPIPGIVNGEADLILSGVNLGSYRLEVFNPKNDGLGGKCPNLLDEILIENEQGTPVELEPFDTEICEGTPAVITPFLDSSYNPGNLPVPFAWYASPDRTGGPLPLNGTATIDGSTVDVMIDADGTITIEGLEADGLNPKTYTLYVETTFRDNPGNAGNFCPFDGEVLTYATIVVYPALEITKTETPDWCRDGVGIIKIEALGGNGDKTFVLLDFFDNVLETQIHPTTATFAGLLPGEYFVEIESANPTCLESVPVTIAGAVEVLTIIEIDKTPASCDLDNGTFSFQISGGNGVLSASSLSISGGTDGGVTYDSSTDVYTYNGLAPGVNYTVTVTDERGCSEPLGFVLDEIQTPEFSINIPGDVCVDVLSLDFTVNYNFFEIQATAIPVFDWYESETGGAAILNGTGPFGMEYSVNSATGALSITALAAGTHTLWLEMSGPDACNLPRISVDFEVFPLPEPIASDLTHISCFGEADGAIQVKLASGNPSDFLYQIAGDNGISIPYADNAGLFENLPAGTYQIFVQNKATGCENEADSVTLVEPDELVGTAGSKSDPNCETDNGTLEFIISGGTPAPNGAYGVTINGQPLAGFTSSTTVEPSGETLISVSDLKEGIYAVQVTDARGCSATVDYTLTAQILPEYALTNTAVCLNETAVILPEVVNPGNPNASPVYHWYKDAAAMEQIVSGNDAALELDFAVDSGTGELRVSNFANAGTYTFYLKPEILNGCDLAAVPVEVAVNPLPAPVFEPVAVSCYLGSDGALELVSGGSGDYTYTLQGGGSTFNSTSNRFEGLPAGNYVIQVVNNVTSCESEFTLEIQEPAELTLTQGPTTDPNCELDNGTLEFTISGGTPAADGSYGVTINGQPLASFVSNTTMQPSGETLISVSDLKEGIYAVQVTDARGCSATVDYTLTAQILPEYALADIAVCLNEIAVILPNVVNQGNPAANPVYRWYKDAAATVEIVPGNDAALELDFAIDTGTGELSVSNFTNAGTYTFYLKPEILNGCDLAAVPVEMVVNPLPEVVFEGLPTSCFGHNDGSIRVVSGGNPGYTYTLGNGTQSADGTFTGLIAGTYEIEVQDQIGCVATFEVEVVQPDELQIVSIEDTDPTCGDFNGEIVFEIVGGTADYVVTVNSSALTEFDHQINGNRYTVQGLQPGSYSIEVSDANTCTDAAPNLFNLTNNEGLEIVSNPIQEEICEGGTARLAPQLTVPAGASPVLRWYFDASATQEITSSPSPDANGITYQISGLSVLTVEGLAPGVYSYYLRISGNGICTKITEASLVVNPPVAAEPIATAITCFGGSDGQIEISNPTGGNGTYEYSLDGGAWVSSPLFDNLPAKSYQVRVRDTSGLDGCTFQAQVEIHGPSSAIEIDNPDTIRASCDLPNGAIRNLVVSGGWGSYTFEWRKNDPQTGDVMPQGTLEGIEGLEPGDYYLVLSDEGGCEEYFHFPVGESSDPVYAVVPPINSCFGTPIEIKPIHIAPNPSLPPAAATEVKWYKNPGQTGLIENGSDAQDPSVIYIIDDTDWLNPVLEIENLPVGDHDFYFYVVCTGQEIKIDITVFDTPAVVIETDPITCFGDSDGRIRIVSGDDPSYVFQLDGGNDLTKSELENLNLSAGNYQLVIPTPAGCPQVIDLEIEGPAAALAIEDLAQIDPGCGSANGKINATITGGWAPYSIELFRNGASHSKLDLSDSDLGIDGLTLGSYYFVVTDDQGCQTTSSVLTLVDGPTQILVDDKEICEGEALILVPVLDPPVSSPTFTWSFDLAGNNLITSSASPAADGMIYQINAQGQLTVTGLPASNQPYRYYVKAEGAGICLGYVAQPEVMVFGTPNATPAVQNEVCFGEGGSITINASGGGGNYQYSLDGGATYQTSNVFNMPAGVYELSLLSSSGCEFVLPGIEIQGPSAPIAVVDLVGKNSSCNLDNGEISFTVTGGYGDFGVQTIKNGVIYANGQADSNGYFVISGLGIGEYSFEIEDGQGCGFVLSSPLDLVEEPTQVFLDDQTLCVGETAVLAPTINSNSPNLSFDWYFDANASNPIRNSTVSGVTYTIASDGRLSVEGLVPRADPYTYYVLAKGLGVCGLDPEPVNVTVSELASLRVSNPSVVCDPAGTVDLTQFIEGFNPSTYDYSILSPSGVAMQLSELGAVAQSGDYRVSSSFKGASCWNAPQRIRVIIADELLVAEFEYQVDLGGGQVFVNGEIQIQEDVQFLDLSVGKVLIWEWDFGDGSTSMERNPVHQYLSKGTYTVTLTATDEFGCQAAYVMVVNVFDDYNVMVPNAFTPDGSKNQYFKPVYRGIAGMELFIFNTWGELIFESNSLETLGWDGTLNGTPVPNGNYVYRAKFTSRSGEKFEKAGVFILIR